MGPQFGDSFCRFGCSILRLPTWEAPNLVTTQGGGGRLGLSSHGLFPKQKEYSFLPCSSYLQDISLMFLMLYSPLDTVLLLVLLQPSGDGYFRLCSSKNSFRGTVTVPLPSALLNLPKGKSLGRRKPATNS